MKSKCCVYARIASCFRGSHSLHPHTGLYPQRQIKRLPTLITPSSSPVASRCEVGCTMRLMGALQREHAGFINAPPAWCDVATHSCAPWRVSDKVPVPVSMILYEPRINISHSIGLAVTQLKRSILSHREERGTIWAQSQTATRSLRDTQIKRGGVDALLVISKSFDLAIEETSVYDIGGWVESEVEYLRVDRDDWHGQAQRVRQYSA